MTRHAGNNAFRTEKASGCGVAVDANHHHRTRNHCLVERFSPNGDPRLITPPIGHLTHRRRGYLGRTPKGWFKLVRELGDDGQEHDELYHLYSELVPSRSNEVDPYELYDLLVGPSNFDFVTDYLQLRLELEALLATEP